VVAVCEKYEFFQWRQGMNTHAAGIREGHRGPPTKLASREGRDPATAAPALDNHPASIAQRELRAAANDSSHVRQLMAFQESAGNNPQVRRTAQLQAMMNHGRGIVQGVFYPPLPQRGAEWNALVERIAALNMRVGLPNMVAINALINTSEAE
jgi:phytoene dehydrogenase-like protein